MKNFDLFQKVTIENSSKRPTLLGALISFLAISLMIYVLCKQLHEYFFRPLIVKDTIIFQDQDGSSTIPVNLGILFPKLPCSIISVDQEDLIGHHRLNIHDTVFKTPIDSQKQPNGNHFDAHKTGDLNSAISNAEGCIVSGVVPISKVQGDIHISFHAYREIFAYLMNQKLHDKITLAHSFSLLNFGDTSTLKRVLERFQMTELESNFNRVGNLPKNENYSWEYDYDYFIKIIPQVFEDKYTQETIVAYQYSLTFKAKERSDTMNMPIIVINYDFSPVAVKYTMERRYFSHLITSICALVGGIFVIFSLLNSALLRMLDGLGS